VGKDKGLYIRVSEVELAEWKAKAQERNQSVSAFIRAQVNGSSQKPVSDPGPAERKQKPEPGPSEVAPGVAGFVLKPKASTIKAANCPREIFHRKGVWCKECEWGG